MSGCGTGLRIRASPTAACRGPKGKLQKIDALSFDYTYLPPFIASSPMCCYLTTPSACLESGGIKIPVATPQHARELSNAPSSCGATATNYEAADLDMADDDLIPGEWEGEIVGEVIDKGITLLKYMIAWVPILEPEANVGLEMKKAWEAEKAAMLAPKEKIANSVGSLICPQSRLCS